MSQDNQPKLIHWADFAADRIIRQQGDKETYTVASGITPSGDVHFGNFRETITVDLVARALKSRGKKVRFIFSWDDYDTFRKVPKNMPKQDELAKYMFQPIVDTPDPYGVEESYAAHHEVSYEAQVKKVGVDVEPIYQAKKYRAGDYKDQIKKALNMRKDIAAILNEHRKEPYGDEYYPVSVYCEKYKTDETEVIGWDGESKITYRNKNHDYEGVIDLNTTDKVKLPWRVDWPMRWVYESVDFEPGGKDHSSQGGSYTTAKDIVKLFGGKPPVYLQYDFVSIKGAGGKMSSSSGNLVTVNDVLKVYEPEMVRWTFASYKTNVDFSVSFDLDVLKTYEDFDRQERLAYGLEAGNEKKVNMAKRVYEFSQIGEQPAVCPFQPSFRHLCNILQINDGNIDKARSFYASEIKNERDERRFSERSKCALYWLENYAPEDFKFKINTSAVEYSCDDKQTEFMTSFVSFMTNDWDSISTDKELHEKMYEIIHSVEVQPNDVFPVMYQKLICKEKGPKLAGFIRTIGKDRVIELFK
ncbi:lysine--tRNA ligase [Halobacteriovorax marinus]|uniref:Lysine--tRNA ligase n=1 Tax=Halobacteriovorax marinus TaxID=97084 RepID=A0A1Y5F3P6_9BACT|nr:lysine--tRNA ligase [Halobacteriovorax marinus]